MEVNTTEERFNVDVDGKHYIHFMAVAYDKAGNCDTYPVAGSGKSSRSYASYTIDQMADCPVITFSNITATDGKQERRRRKIRRNSIRQL